MVPYNLYPSQKTAVAEIMAAYHDPIMGPFVYVCATGAGKSIISAQVTKDILYDQPSDRILMLVPTKELVEQNYDKLIKYIPNDMLGIMSASAGTKEDNKAVTLGTIGSVMNNPLRRYPKTIIIDECHLVNTKNVGQYRKYINQCIAVHGKENVNVIGLTATPYRGNGIWLNAGANPVFEYIMINPACQMKQLTDKGYLTPLREVSIPLGQKIQMPKEATRNADGEYKIEDISKAVDPHIYDRTLKSIQYCDQLNVKKAMVVTATIAHAEMINNYLISKGQKSVVVHSKSNNRDKNVKAFKDGDARFIVSVSTLTTGFDVSALEMIINLRQIGAKTLYVQLMGRGTRLHTFPDGRKKECCWILDWTTSTSDLGPVDEVSGRLPRGGKSAAAVKHCPQCDWVVPVQTRICGGCQHEFEFNVNFQALLNLASDAPVMSGDYQLHKEVDNWIVEKHISQKGTQSIRISFMFKGEVVFKEYLAYHALGTNAKPKRLWTILGGGDIPPESFNAAWNRRGNLTCPDFIQLEMVLKKLQIKDAIYAGAEVTDTAEVVEKETDLFT